MVLGDEIAALINADLDGEISPANKRELDKILASNDKARTYHDDLSKLIHTMDAATSVEPPAHLHFLIMDSIKPEHAQPRKFSSISRILASPAMRLSGAFAVGVVLTLSLMSSDRLSTNAFEDVTNLVGTISNSESNLPARTAISISQTDVAGTVSALRSGPILVIDFDLVSSGSIDVIAGFESQDVWFNGFAQLESNGASVAAEPGRVTIHMEGKRRYALYLHDAGSRVETVNLQFVSSGTIVHQMQLSTGSTK